MIHPGLHQIETQAGGNRLCLYLLMGERYILLDSGTQQTPQAVIAPLLRGLGGREAVDMVLISHADADHHGGNHALQQQSPQVMIACHELDRARVASKTAHMTGRYETVVAADDFAYDTELRHAIANMIGEDTPVHMGLQGGETLIIGDEHYEILHTPGHTAGHIALWDANRRLLLMQDAVLGQGVPDQSGAVISPPPYYAVASYKATIHQLRSLEPDYVFSAHYPDMRAEAAQQFFTEALHFVQQVEAAVMTVLIEQKRPLSLVNIMAVLDEQFGPFPVFIQWVGPALAHLHALKLAGHIHTRPIEGVRHWQIGPAEAALKGGDAES